MSLSSNINENSYRFSEGTLYLTKGSSESVIKGWSEPSARRRTKYSDSWEPFVPDFQLVRPLKKEKVKGGLDEWEKIAGQQTFDFFDKVVRKEEKPKPQSKIAIERKRALRSFRESLPEEVAKSLESFRHRQWFMLLFLYHDQDAIDLADSNPALAFFLSQILEGDIEKIRTTRCGTMRQRDTLSLLGLPSTSSAVKLLGKIQPASVTGDNWCAIIRMLGEELGKKKTPLTHLSTINFGALEIVADPVASLAATPSLIEEVANDNREKYRGRAVHMLRAAIDMQDELQVRKKVSSFPSLSRLFEVHERASSQYRRRIRQLNDAELVAASGNFGDPPIPGIPGVIEPITSPKELVDEGEEQGNCVASYARKMLTGDIYIYRVIEPERSTLSIVRKRSGGWKIGELEAKFNVAASKETEKAVTKWLKANQPNQTA